MAYRNGPKIVTDGLVLCLDAAIGKSYPGSGTTWYDLSGNGNNVSLINGPVFNTNNKGSFVFDSTDDQGLLSSLITLSDFTIECASLCRYTYSPLFSYQANIYYEYIRLDCSADGGRILVVFGNGNQVTFSGFGNFCDTIKHFVIKRDGSDLSIYIDNSLISTATCSTNNFRIDRLCKGNAQVGNQDLFFAKIYNRALSSDEITQNYKATKGRFGL